MLEEPQNRQVPVYMRGSGYQQFTHRLIRRRCYQVLQNGQEEFG